MLQIGQPTPEPQHYADAQLASILDPSSSRDTMLVTHGSAMPSYIPKELHTGMTSRGFVITKDPAKIKIIHEGDEKQVGQALFGYDHDQSKGYTHGVVAHNANGVPVAELAVPSDLAEVNKAVKAAGLLAPENGTVSILPGDQVIAHRITSLLG